MTGNCGQDAEEESSASEGKTETVGKPTGKVWQREVTNKLPPDHESDQEDKEDEESSSEVNRRADQMEFIKDFQDVMNQTIEQLLNKSARRHSR